jgi:hypothetical protein
MYITNKFKSIKLPVEPGMLEWLRETYPNSGYYIVEKSWLVKSV